MLYQAYQTQSDLLSPLRLMAQHLSASLWLQDTERSVVRKVAAACDVLSRLRLTHTRPPYNIHAVTVEGREIPVVEETVLSLPARADGLLLVPERHTRNLFYLTNVARLVRILRQTGVEVRVGTLSDEVTQRTPIELPNGETLVLEPFAQRLAQFQGQCAAQ